MQLYKISQQLEDLWEIIAQTIDTDTVTAPEGEVITRDVALARLEEALKNAEGTHASKCLDIACLIKDFEAEAEAIRDEEKRLAARRKAAESKVSWLRRYLEVNMEPGVNLKDARAQIGWRKSTAVEVLVPAEQLPERFQRTKVIVEADKTAIKDALKSGDTELQSKAALAERHSVQIK